MTPQQKAKELVIKMQFSKPPLMFDKAKQCALITIDEMIIQNGNLYLNGIDNKYYKKINGYLFEVKSEILKL